MPDKVIVEIFQQSPFGSVEKMSQYLDTLHSSLNFIPTHWAKNERPSDKRKYVRDEVLFYGEDIGDYGLVHLYRQQPPVYTLYFESNKRFKPSVLRLSFEEAKDFSIDMTKEIFEISSTFAHQLEAIFGYVWLAWYGDEEKYMPIKSVRSGELARYGPNPVHARTWLGFHLIKLIGRDILSQCNETIRDTEWGGVEMDLMPEPWSAALDELVNRQREVMECLQETEVFGDYSSFPIFHPGKRWVHWES